MHIFSLVQLSTVFFLWIEGHVVLMSIITFKSSTCHSQSIVKNSYRGRERVHSEETSGCTNKLRKMHHCGWQQSGRANERSKETENSNCDITAHTFIIMTIIDWSALTSFKTEQEPRKT